MPHTHGRSLLIIYLLFVLVCRINNSVRPRYCGRWRMQCAIALGGRCWATWPAHVHSIERPPHIRGAVDAVPASGGTRERWRACRSDPGRAPPSSAARAVGRGRGMSRRSRACTRRAAPGCSGRAFRSCRRAAARCRSSGQPSTCAVSRGRAAKRHPCRGRFRSPRGRGSVRGCRATARS